MVAKYRNILVAVDGSEQSEQALNEAISIAKRDEAWLTMITSIDLSTISYAHLMVREVTQVLLSKAKDMMDDFTYDESKIQIEKVVSKGIPKHEIVNYAKENNIDLIVMGATGKGAVDRVLIGSTTTHVVGYAPCKVMVVR